MKQRLSLALVWSTALIDLSVARSHAGGVLQEAIDAQRGRRRRLQALDGCREPAAQQLGAAAADHRAVDVVQEAEARGVAQQGVPDSQSCGKRKLASQERRVPSDAEQLWGDADGVLRLTIGPHKSASISAEDRSNDVTRCCQSTASC